MRRADRQHGRPLLREMNSVVARIPDVLDAHRLLWARVEVPVLPVEERALRDRRRTRERQRACDDRPGRDQCQLARTLGHAGEQCEGHRKDCDTATELVAPRQERGGPAGADEEEHDSQERVARCDRERDREREAEDRNEDDRVHRRMGRRVEREPEVVEVEEAAREPGADRSEEAVAAGPECERREREHDAGGDQRRKRDAHKPQPERPQQHRSDGEGSEDERAAAARPRLLEPKPVDGDHERRRRRERDRLKHARHPVSARRRGTRRVGRRHVRRRRGLPRPGDAAAQAPHGGQHR